MTDCIEVDEFARDPLAFVDQVATGRANLVITRDGSRVAALVNMRDSGSSSGFARGSTSCVISWARPSRTCRKKRVSA
jgi:hypothetical protein